MVFAVDGNKLTTFDASGAKMNEGKFEFTHDQPEDGVMGLLKTDIPVIGSEFDDNGVQAVGNTNTFYILTLNDKYLASCSGAKPCSWWITADCCSSPSTATILPDA